MPEQVTTTVGSENYTITATGTPSNATEDKTVTFSVINNNGVIGNIQSNSLQFTFKALKEGTATIKATSNAHSNLTKTCVITVNPEVNKVPITSISIRDLDNNVLESIGTNEETALYEPDGGPGDTMDIKIVINPQEGYTTQWRYDYDASIIDVTKIPNSTNEYTITAINPGNTTLTVYTEDNIWNGGSSEISASCNIKILAIGEEPGEVELLGVPSNTQTLIADSGFKTKLSVSNYSGDITYSARAGSNTTNVLNINKVGTTSDTFFTDGQNPFESLEHQGSSNINSDEVTDTVIFTAELEDGRTLSKQVTVKVIPSYIDFDLPSGTMWSKLPTVDSALSEGQTWLGAEDISSSYLVSDSEHDGTQVYYKARPTKDDVDEFLDYITGEGTEGNISGTNDCIKTFYKQGKVLKIRVNKDGTNFQTRTEYDSDNIYALHIAGTSGGQTGLITVPKTEKTNVRNIYTHIRPYTA